MSHVAIANDGGQSTLKSPGLPNSIWKKNSHHSKSDYGNTKEGLLPNTVNNIVPFSIGNGMNRRHIFQQQQQASNGAFDGSSTTRGNPQTATNGVDKQALNFNNVSSMQTSNQSSGHPVGEQGQNAWLQHMILNPINPLHNNLNSVGNNAGGNGVGGLQQQVPPNFTSSANNDIFQQQQLLLPTQLGDAAMGTQSVVVSLKQQQQQPTLTQPIISSQPQQQQQNLHQLLPLNDIASRLQQLPAMRQSQPVQQPPVVATTNNSHLPAIPNTVSAPASTQQQQQQQQQQILLLALMLQQQNNTTNSAGNADTSALKNALASTEGLRLINSLLLGQQLPQVQGISLQQQQQQQQQVTQDQVAVSGSLPSSSGLGVDQLVPPFILPTIQEDNGVSNHHLFLSQQQPQLPNQTQSQVLSQSFQLTPTSFLNPTAQSSGTPNGLGNNGDSSSIQNGTVSLSAADAISNLTMTADSGSFLRASKTNDNGGSGHLAVGSSKTVENSKTPTANPHFPRLLYCESDDAILGEYQTLLRQQLELFEADSHDVINGTFRQGRTTPIRLGQIGLRCKHCAKAPLSARTKGSVYFSQTIKGMYQIGQNMSKVHLCERCPRLPPDIKKRMVTLRSRRHRASGGRAYWIRHLREVGIYEDGTVLRAHPPGFKGRSQTATKSANIKK